jgi:hypothetical protein
MLLSYDPVIKLHSSAGDSDKENYKKKHNSSVLGVCAELAGDGKP